MRQAVCNYSLKNSEGIIKKIRLAFIEDDSDETFEQYFNRMKKNAVYAGMTEMFVIYLLFNINVISYSNQVTNEVPHVYQK